MPQRSHGHFEYPSTRSDRLSNKVLVGFLALAFTGLAADRMIESGFDPNDIFKSKQSHIAEEALKHARHISTSTFIVGSGVNLRTTPEISYGSNDSPPNKGKQVPANKVLVVEHPVWYKGFIGFSYHENNAEKSRSRIHRAAEMKWVAAQELQEHQPELIREIKEPDSPDLIKGHMGRDGVIRLSNAGEHLMGGISQIATAHLKPAIDYEQPIQ